MSEIKLVLYKENRVPRSIALSTRTIYRTLFLTVLSAILLLVSLGLAAKFYMLSKAKSAYTAAPVSSSDSEVGPSNSLEEQNKNLTDQIAQMKSSLENAKAIQNSSKEIDKSNPALALFAPIVANKTQGQDKVHIQNIRFSKSNGKSPATLTFELHNAHPGESTEKGYIVVIGRTGNSLTAYPNVFNKTGPYLLDFEKGETFQVARFRLVNAQFDINSQNFQIFIFTRNGELLVNTMFEAKDG